MSFDLGFWVPTGDLSDEEAGRIYGALCDGDMSDVPPHPAVTALRNALDVELPELMEVAGYATTSCVILTMPWSTEDDVIERVLALAEEHGVLVYDPQGPSIAQRADPQPPPPDCSCLPTPGSAGGAASWGEYAQAKRRCPAHGRS